MLKDYTMTPNRAGIPVWRPAQPVIGREDEHQTALTNWARMMRTQYPALTLYHHIPNGGLRDKRTTAPAVLRKWRGKSDLHRNRPRKEGLFWGDRGSGYPC